MIVELYKYLIYGKKGEMDHFFSLAQRAGFLEFIGASHKKALALPPEAKLLLSAIKIAKHHTVYPEEDFLSQLDSLEVAQKLVSLQTEQEKLFEEKRVLTAEISRIAPFGDFSRRELDQFEREAKRIFQFFCMKSSLARELSLPPEMIFVASQYDLDYFVAINKEPKQYPKMIEIQIDQPAPELRRRLARAGEELAKVEEDLRTFSHALPRLQNDLVRSLNEYSLRLAKHDANLALGESLFAIEAWIPKTRVKALHGLLSNLSIQCERIAIESKDQIPTYMENRGVGKLGEDLIQIYDTPAPTDQDPSLWLLCFFSLFFAMIINDAGYGLIYFLLALVVKWKCPRMGATGKRFLKLVWICSGTCIVWGIAAGSYFGIEIGPNNPLRKTSVLHILAAKKAAYHLAQKDDVYEEYVREFPSVATAKDGHEFLAKAVITRGDKLQFKALDTFYDNLLMELSFVVGVIHISLSFLRYLTRNWAGFGWVCFILGGYLYFPSMLNATTLANILGISKPLSQAIGMQLTLEGLGLVLLLALVQKGWGAFHELLHVVQVFADVLSYVRLYALALGGMVMAHTFNDRLGISLPFFLGIFVILIGHAINLLLSLMGGTIHGLRLNFLEWYHYSFVGGGRLFNPLRLRKTK